MDNLELENFADNKLALQDEFAMKENAPLTSANEPPAKKHGPLQLDELPAPLRKLYAKSLQGSQQQQLKSIESGKKYSNGSEKFILNEPLLGGFALLRAAQLLNIDVYYVGLETRSCGRILSSGGQKTMVCWQRGDVEAIVAGKNVPTVRSCSSIDRAALKSISESNDDVAIKKKANRCYRTILDDLAECNPLQKYIDDRDWLRAFCRLAKIFLSLAAIMMGFNELISTILLCLVTTIGSKKLDNIGSNQTTAATTLSTAMSSNSENQANSSVGLLVLVLVQFSSIYILFSTIFNGHLLWNLFSQRQFLVSKRFQYKTMLRQLTFIYLEYIINTAFVSNLYDWDAISNNIEAANYSMLANLRILVTYKDFDHFYVDILMSVISFARGIIRVSPYITINYVIICLREHISTIRNQRLLTDSLKRRQKLRVVVGKTSARSGGKSAAAKAVGLLGGGAASRSTKRVNFVTEPPTRRQTIVSGVNDLSRPVEILGQRQQSQRDNLNQEATGSELLQRNGWPSEPEQLEALKAETQSSDFSKNDDDDNFLERIESFDELEAYITNLYIFTGKLNRFMSSQGLTVFFIVHNLLICASLIRPEVISGGTFMVQLIRLLLILIAIKPFVAGQSLTAQLAQLSKQIDRIIIQQHFIHRRRDNLVRIRELIHDIRINCGGMLNFNVATGIKYLVGAFACAFFIEQEHYKLTRRNKTDDIRPTMSWVMGFPIMTGGGSGEAA